jgi:hypothetical protein
MCDMWLIMRLILNVVRCLKTTHPYNNLKLFLKVISFVCCMLGSGGVG